MDYLAIWHTFEVPWGYVPLLAIQAQQSGPCKDLLENRGVRDLAVPGKKQYLG